MRNQPGRNSRPHNIVQDLPMGGRVAHHPPFPDSVPSGLKLRLDESNNPGSGHDETLDRRQYQTERNERHINAGSLDLWSILAGSGQRKMLQNTDVGPLQNDNSLILSKPPVKLPVANVYCIDPAGPALEQHVGEAAGRGSHIEGKQPGGRESKCIERVGQLISPTAHIGEGVCEHNLAGCINSHPRFGLHLPIDADLPRHQESPGPGASFGKPASHKQLVQSGAGHCSPRKTARISSPVRAVRRVWEIA